MKIPLNVLIVEDLPNDAELTLVELRRAGFDPKWTRVETEPGFLAELKKSPDIILSDYSMPQFNGLRAADLLQKSGLNIPFILISGTVGEDVAVEAMRHGATDYLLKDRIVRLGVAVKQALEKKQLYEQQKLAAEALRQSREEFKDLFDNAPVGFHELDAEGRIIRVNNTELKMLGCSAEELLGQFVWKISTEEEISRKAVLVLLSPEGSPPASVERILRRKDGSTFPAIINNRRLKREDGAITGIRATIQDITERKRAEELLARERNLLRMMFDSLPGYIYLKDEQSRFIMCNSKRAVNDAIQNSDDLIGKTDAEFFPPEQAAQFRADELEVLAGTPLVDKEEILIRPDGSRQILLTSKLPFRDTNGKIIGLFGYGRDITKRKQAEEKLRENEADLAEAQRVAKMGSWQYDLASKKVRWSDELCRIFEIEKTLFDGKHETFLNYVLPDDRPRVLQTNAGARTNGSSFEIEYRIQTRAGDLKTVREIGYAIKDAEGRVTGLFGTAQDITERKKLETQFIEAQKMEVIGQLAGGIAHDFNNILGVIIGYNDLMMPELDPESLSRKCADEIRAAAERAVALTRQLLLFSRKQAVQTVVLNLHEVIEDMDKMLRRLIDENVGLTIVPEKETGRIKADSGLIGQLLMNLVVNARDAMPNGGRVKIETANVTLDENDARTRACPTSGDYVMLAVSDTGIGMTAEVKARLFEAFFTTKPKGKGTGLGLATCQTIVKQFGGCIEVQSELGKGTTFKIYFPRVEQPAEPVDMLKKAANAKPLVGGTETILLVEDEPSVRHLACSILEAQGYNVVRSNNGQDALHAARDHKGSPIRLVVTDVIMPLMSGKVMAEWLKVTYPDMKILFTSGYTDDALAQHGVLEAGVQFLSKPYTPAALARRVRAMLDNETDTAVIRKQEKTINQSSAAIA
jgi:PAS domain S-box-containing protein